MRKTFWRTFLKDQSFRLVHWLSIALSPRKTSQESINVERKSYLYCSLDKLCRRCGIWKGDTMVADIEEFETMDASEIYSKKKTQCKGSNISETKWKIHFSSRRWTNKICWRRSGTEYIHLDTGPPNSRRRSRRFSRIIRRVSTSATSRLISRMPLKQEMTFGPCQETSHTAITLNPESNCTRREKNHSSFH